MLIKKCYYVEATKEARTAVRIISHFAKCNIESWDDGELTIDCPQTELTFIEKILAPFV